MLLSKRLETASKFINIVEDSILLVEEYKKHGAKGSTEKELGSHPGHSPGGALILELQCKRSLKWASVSPLDSFAKELKLGFPVQLENPHVISINQIWAGVVSLGPSGCPFQDMKRNSHTEYKHFVGCMNEMKSKVIKICNLLQCVVGIFLGGLERLPLFESLSLGVWGTCVVNNCWISCFSDSSLLHLEEKVGYDHRTLLLKLIGSVRGRRHCPFRLISTWQEHLSFKEFLLLVWKRDLPLDVNQELPNMAFYRGPSKSQGIDGPNTMFFQHNWLAMGEWICLFVRQVYDGGVLPPHINHTLLVLLPKIANPKKMSQFKPISNVVYKAITKVIVNHTLFWVEL
ncbi:hypothetical protein V6N13_087607 [Hibiscus sabdariffa]